MRRVNPADVDCIRLTSTPIVAVLILVFSIPANAGSTDEPPAAAELVQGILDLENKVHEYDSMLIRMSGKWTQTPRFIAARRQEIEEQLGTKEIPADRLLELRPTYTESEELVFDAKRIRIHEASQDLRLNVSVWNGTLGKHHSLHIPHQSDHCAVSSQCQFFEHVPCLVWLKVGPHRFWWSSREVWSGYGSPNEFRHAGRKTYRDRECYVLEAGRRATLYVGVDDRRLHGLVNCVSDAGIMRPQFEAYLDDYREVAPGFWLPFEHGYTLFELEGREVYAKSQRDLKIVEVQTNPKLTNELFELDIPEGAMTSDHRYNPPLMYQYKKDRTDAEMQELVAKRDAQLALAKEILQKQDERIAKLLGQAACELPNSIWLNSDPLSWKNLTGRVVILDFFAEWCGPCRGDLPLLKTLYAQRENSGITVIAVHTPGSELETVKKFAEEFEIEYPVCIDVDAESKDEGFGQVSAWYGVRGIPHSVLIDSTGRVAGHGPLREVIVKARKMVDSGKE